MAEQHELDRLSKAATQGVWEVIHHRGVMSLRNEHGNVIGDDEDYYPQAMDEDDAHFITALVNAYRTGKLRVVGEGEVVVKQVELDELRQRMPWAGGRSPITCGVSGSISAVERKRKAATAGGEHEG